MRGAWGICPMPGLSSKLSLMDIDLDLARTLAAIQKRFLALDPDRRAVASLLEDVATIVRADAAMAAWLNEGTPLLVTWNTGPQIEAYLARTFAGVDRSGNVRSTDPVLDQINLTRRQMGDAVRHERAYASRGNIERAAFHREAFRPGGMNHVIGMTTRLAVGEAVFTMGYADGEAPALARGLAETVLTLLLPAFASGFARLDDSARSFEMLQRSIEDSDMEVSLREKDCASAALLNVPLPEPSTGYLSVSPPGAAMQAARLAKGYGLTDRQRQTAQCLLDGLSTKELAARLGISPNTARRHCEDVLHRTGARRRAELNRLARNLPQ